MAHYVRVRQHYLVSPAHSSTAQACTLLVMGIPPKYLSESALTRLFSHLPGGVRKVWINRNLGDMPDLYNRRLKACKMLESAQTSLLGMAVKRTNKNASNSEATRRTLIEELVPKKKWPSHRLLPSWMPFSIPFIGRKVDTVEWSEEQLRELNMQLEQRREILARDIARTTTAEVATTNRTHQIGAGKLNITIPAVPVAIPLVGARPVVDFSDQTYPPANGAFILFNEQIAAHLAAQTLTHHEPYRMPGSLKYVEVAPEDVIWDNLVINPYDRRIRLALSWAATIGLIIVWAFPG
jgi:calcium permeable stress-gated cation channel